MSVPRIVQIPHEKHAFTTLRSLSAAKIIQNARKCHVLFTCTAPLLVAKMMIGLRVDLGKDFDA